jgi:uncharacterized membrane protein HdeD (DUF308 family)
MTAAHTRDDHMQATVAQAVHRHWTLFMVQGILMIVLGLIAVAEPLVATLAVEIFAGWIFLFGGIVALIGLFRARHMPGFVWGLISAVLAILVGLFLIARPLAGILSLTLVLAGFFAAQGVLEIIAAFEQRALLPRSWFWMLLNGVIDLFLAGIIMAGWPGSAAWVLGLLVGINLFMTGLALVMTAVACRDAIRDPRAAIPARGV